MIRFAQRTVFLFVLLFLAMGCRRHFIQAGVPDVLKARGFGDLTQPVFIDWFFDMEGMQGAATAGGQTPAKAGTRWVFGNAAPVWACFSGIRTGEFMEGAYAGSMASMTVQVGAGPEPGRLIFHSTPDFASVVSPPGKPEGGSLYLDPVAAERLLKLISNRAPSELPVDALAVRSCLYVGPDRTPGVSVRVCASAEAWAAMESEFGDMCGGRGEALPVPRGFRWDKGFVMAAWLRQENGGNVLEGRALRRSGDTLKWRVTCPPLLGRESSGMCPAVVAFVVPPVRLTRVEIWLEEEKVQECRIRQASRLVHMPPPGHVPQ